MTILVMGLLSIVLFGAVVIYYSRQTPILRLRPELEHHYGVSGFETRFISQGLPYIQVLPPAELPLADEYARAELGVWALLRYQELTEHRTVITECQVVLPDGTQTVVDEQMVEMLDAAHASLDQMRQVLLHAGLSDPQVQITGVVRSGVHVAARAQASAELSLEERRLLTRKTAQALVSFSCLSKIELEVTATGGPPVVEAAGRDAPPPPRRPRPPLLPPPGAEGPPPTPPPASGGD